MSTSTVPAVLTGLVTTITTALGTEVPSGAVVYGQPLPNQYGDFVAVGWNDEGPAVELVQTNPDLALQTGLEEYDVHCQVVSWNGDPDKAPDVAARVYLLLDLIETAIVADVQLGDACNAAQLTGSSYQPAQTEKGPMAVLSFTVHVNAARSLP